MYDMVQWLPSVGLSRTLKRKAIHIVSGDEMVGMPLLSVIERGRLM